MASFSEHLKNLAYLNKWEGGWANHPADKGGKTNRGVILATWNYYAPKYGWQSGEQGLRNMSEQQWRIIIKEFWNLAKGDTINDQVIAEKVFEITWGSGPGNAGIVLQRALNRIGKPVKIDGGIGPQTLKATNEADPKALFNALHLEHEIFLRNIVKNDPTQAVFLDGWINRIYDFYNKKKT